MLMPIARAALVATSFTLIVAPQAIWAQEATGDLVGTPDETKAEARDSEALLLPEDRMALQTALQWFGFYAGAIDGDYGPGTRKSMAAWQEAQGVDATGVLTTRQRAALLGAYQEQMAVYGFASVRDAVCLRRLSCLCCHGGIGLVKGIL